MKTFKRALGIAVTAACGVMAGQTVAAETGGYIGVGIGQSRIDLDENEINSAFASLGLGATTSVDKTDIGFKVYGGYQFNRNVALELGYTDFGKFTSHSIVTSGGSGTLDAEWKAYAVDLSVLGILPLGQSGASLFVRGGGGAYKLKFDATAVGPGGTASTSESKSGFAPLLGLGATYDFTPNFGVRAEIERHFDLGDEDTTGKGDVDLISVAVQFRF
ncbi:MAG TPA: outer membrane beta-barrel protein [Burkholderiales bacterium]|nr:outer membrane beta-barrel protein [Burkholderiales bacterium]